MMIYKLNLDEINFPSSNLGGKFEYLQWYLKA